MNDTDNRINNAHNPSQGNRLRVLCLCSAGLLRSPTIAWVLSNPPFYCNTRAAGVTKRYALVTVDEVLLEWAQEIVCAHQSVADELYAEWAHLMPNKDNVTILDIPDRYPAFNAELVQEIEKQLMGFGVSSLRNFA